MVMVQVHAVFLISALHYLSPHDTTSTQGKGGVTSVRGRGLRLIPFDFVFKSIPNEKKDCYLKSENAYIFLSLI